MKDKLKAWAIHKLGGFTAKEMEESEKEHRLDVAHWRDRCAELVNQYGQIEIFCARRTVDTYALHEYERKIAEDMVKELLNAIAESAGHLIEREHSDNYERNLRTVTMFIRVVRKRSF